MEYEGNLKYNNMTRPIIELITKYSTELQSKLIKQKNHGLNMKPIQTKQLMDRWQIDLIDFRIDLID